MGLVDTHRDRLGLADMATHAVVVGRQRLEPRMLLADPQVGTKRAQTPERAREREHDQNRERTSEQHDPARLSRSRVARLRPSVAAAIGRTLSRARPGKLTGMSRSATTLRAFLLLTFGLGLGMITSAGCNDENDEIGTPCDVDDDCSGDLVCDIHEGQGTCQETHAH